MPAASRLHILQTCFSPSWGGLEMQALEVSRHLLRRGHAVWLACGPATRLAREADASGVSVVPVRVTGYFHPGAVLLLHRRIGELEIQIVHSHLSRDLATLAPALALRHRHIPLLLSKRVGSGISKRDPLHRLTYARVSMVLAVSSVIHRNVVETTPVPSERVLTLHDAIDVATFAPRTGPSTLRTGWGVDPETVVVGFVGRFSPGKGLEELLDATAGLRDLGRRFHVVVAGEASFGEEAYERGIRERARALRLDSLVTFAGFRQDIPAVMAGFDIFAFPSHAESFGVALIEAMAMGLPVVSTNCDGVLDIVVDGETGLFIPPRNAAALAGALDRLIGDPSMRARLGCAGRQRAVELFDREKQIDRLEALYRSLCRPGEFTEPRGS